MSDAEKTDEFIPYKGFTIRLLRVRESDSGYWAWNAYDQEGIHLCWDMFSRAICLEAAQRMIDGRIAFHANQLAQKSSTEERKFIESDWVALHTAVHRSGIYLEQQTTEFFNGQSDLSVEQLQAAKDQQAEAVQALELLWSTILQQL